MTQNTKLIPTRLANTNNNKAHISIIAAIVIIGLITAVPVFAVESYPSWVVNQAVPNGSADEGERKARASTNGHNGVYAESNQAYESRQAFAKNNYQANPYVTSNPTLTTSSNIVGYAADIDFNGDITYGFGSFAWYAGGAELLKKSGSDWYRIHSCHYIVEGGDSYDESRTQKCSYQTNVETNEFRVGGSHKASAFNFFSGINTIVDFYTSSNGYYANTDRLEMCVGYC